MIVCLRTQKPIDLGSVDIHPQAGLTSLILLLRCRSAVDTGHCRGWLACRASRPSTLIASWRTAGSLDSVKPLTHAIEFILS
jgi:hypothetical protein